MQEEIVFPPFLSARRCYKENGYVCLFLSALKRWEDNLSSALAILIATESESSSSSISLTLCDPPTLLIDLFHLPCDYSCLVFCELHESDSDRIRSDDTTRSPARYYQALINYKNITATRRDFHTIITIVVNLTKFNRNCTR